MQILKKHKKQKGFSLVELSVVVTLIGVIVAAIIGGEKLYEASKIRRITTEVIQYATAINTFKQEYGYWPGDFPQATSFWSGTGNGNGDGLVRFQFLSNNEDIYSWEHLYNAELVQSSYTGQITGGGIHYTKGVNLPVSSAFENITFAFYSYRPAGGNVIYDNITGIKILISRLDSVGVVGSNSGSLVARQAQIIDEKIDDGKASSGNFITYRSAGGCTDLDESASAFADYQLSNTTGDCVMEWYLDKF